MSRPDLAGIGMTSRRTRERLVAHLAASGIVDPRVLQAMLEVPRHIFVDEALASRAYEDSALPIGRAQTISQPYVVARMSEMLVAGGRPARVLEVGSGCGYQSAVLAHLCDRVVGIERIRELLFKAREHLHSLKLGNVRLHHGDGFAGWPEEAPYDGILAAAAPFAIPDALCAQLADGGRLVMPIGPAGAQRLVVVTRSGETLEREEHDHVSFVPMCAGVSD